MPGTVPSVSKSILEMAKPAGAGPNCTTALVCTRVGGWPACESASDRAIVACCRKRWRGAHAPKTKRKSKAARGGLELRCAGKCLRPPIGNVALPSSYSFEPPQRDEIAKMGVPGGANAHFKESVYELRHGKSHRFSPSDRARKSRRCGKAYKSAQKHEGKRGSVICGHPIIAVGA